MLVKEADRGDREKRGGERREREREEEEETDTETNKQHKQTIRCTHNTTLRMDPHTH